MQRAAGLLLASPVSPPAIGGHPRAGSTSVLLTIDFTCLVPGMGLILQDVS